MAGALSGDIAHTLSPSVWFVWMCVCVQVCVCMCRACRCLCLCVCWWAWLCFCVCVDVCMSFERRVWQRLVLGVCFLT